MSDRFQDYNPATPITAEWLNSVDDLLVGLPSSGGSSGIGFLQTGPGAVTRSVASKLQEWVSVKDFGATGLGGADDSAAVVLAVEAIELRGGGVVFFPEGIYKLVAEEIPIRSNIHYLGAGEDATTILLGGSAISAFSSWPLPPGASSGEINAAVIAAPHRDCVHISDMTIDGNYNIVPDGGSDNHQHGIYLFKCRYSTVERVTFQNIWYVGVESFYYTRNNTVRDCHFKNVGDRPTIVSPTGVYYGVGFDNGCAWNKGLNNHFEDCGHAFNMINDFGDSAEGVIIDNNTFKNLEGCFLQGRHGASALSVTNNHGSNLMSSFVDFYAEPSIEHSLGYMRNIRITGNSVNDFNLDNGVSKNGIYVTAYGENVISDNTIIHAVTGAARGIIGIHGQGTPDAAASSFLIESNTLVGNFPNYQAIRVDLTTNAVIGANKLDCKTTGQAMYIAASCTNTTVTADNVIVNAAASDIVSDSTTSKIEGRWLSYTPVMTVSGGVFSLGNGSLSGNYFRMGKEITVQFTFSVGSTTSFGAGGALLVTSPVTSDAAERVGSCLIQDIGVGTNYVSVCRIRGDSKFDFFAPAQVSNTSPFTFATGDQLLATIIYKSAV